MTDIFNFCAGPAMLPQPVMQQAQQEFLNWQQQGCSVMELSHRSQVFMDLAAEAEHDLRALLAVPSNYKVLFTHGGGRGQFSAVPLNLSNASQRAAHVVSGSWSKGAVKEASKYLQADVIGEMHQVDGLQALQDPSHWADFSDAAYLHYCPNETVDGIEIPWIPQTGDVPLVADMSSNILSKPLDVNQFGVIYAGAQKNIGPSGLSVVIVREDLLGKARIETPSIFNYQLLAENDSMYNTPPTYAWYLAGLVFKWLKRQGGLEAMAQRNAEKSQTLYAEIDNNDFYRNSVHPQYRSRMNVPFQLADAALDKTFLQEAEASGLKALKGHRMVGGMRASIYNAMPLEGVQALVSFMQDFSRRYG